LCSTWKGFVNLLIYSVSSQPARIEWLSFQIGKHYEFLVKWLSSESICWNASYFRPNRPMLWYHYYGSDYKPFSAWLCTYVEILLTIEVLSRFRSNGLEVWQHNWQLKLEV
jgi:hypothetical protein